MYIYIYICIFLFCLRATPATTRNTTTHPKSTQLRSNLESLARFSDVPRSEEMFSILAPHFELASSVPLARFAGTFSPFVGQQHAVATSCTCRLVPAPSVASSGCGTRRWDHAIACCAPALASSKLVGLCLQAGQRTECAVRTAGGPGPTRLAATSQA